MRIKLAICIGSLIPAGAEILVVQMIKQLDINKYDIHLFVLERRYHTSLEDEVRNLNIEVTYLKKTMQVFSLKPFYNYLTCFANLIPPILSMAFRLAQYMLRYTVFYIVLEWFIQFIPWLLKN